MEQFLLDFEPNVRFAAFDVAVRLFVVTPDMHRVHRFGVPAEANANFRINLPW